MILSCNCGNAFNFGNPEENPDGEVEGFEFSTAEDKNNEDILLIRCLRCDTTICLHSPEVYEE